MANKKKPKAIKRMAAEESPFRNLIVMGPPGSGKTPMTLSSKRMKTLCLECDRGEESAVLAGSKADKWTIKDYTDLSEAYDYLAFGGGCDDYDFLTWDTVSRFQERGLDQIMAELIQDPKKSHRKAWASDKGEYGQNMNRLAMHAREFVDLPIHFCMVTWEMLYTDPNTDEEKVMPMITGRNMPIKFCGYVGYVLRMEIRENNGKEQRWLTTSTDDGHYYTKDRSGQIKEMRRPNIDDVFDRIESARTRRTDASTRKTTQKESA